MGNAPLAANAGGQGVPPPMGGGAGGDPHHPQQHGGAQHAQRQQQHPYHTRPYQADYNAPHPAYSSEPRMAGATVDMQQHQQQALLHPLPQHQQQQNQHNQQQMLLQQQLLQRPDTLPRVNSDTMMIDGDALNSSMSNSSSNPLETWLDDDTVPTVFRWEHGGRQVYITGTFNNWRRQIPMHRSGNDFTYIHNLKRGKHAFKFIVDDEWRFAPDQPTVADIEGRINNFIDVTGFKAYTGDTEFEKEKAAAHYGATARSAAAAAAAAGGTGGADSEAELSDMDPAGGGMNNPHHHMHLHHHLPHHSSSGHSSHHHHNKPDQDGEVFSHNMPDVDDYTKEPPPLPPHLRHIILNKPPQLQDTAALPVPQHVALNHLYCTAIKDNMMVLGITQRYKTKFVTTVYYSPCASK